MRHPQEHRCVSVSRCAVEMTYVTVIKKQREAFAEDTWHRWRSSDTRQRQGYDTLFKKKKKAGSVRTHGANVLYDRRERMAERWRKWAVDGAVQIKTGAERRVGGESYLVYFRTRNSKKKKQKTFGRQMGRSDETFHVVFHQNPPWFYFCHGRQGSLWISPRVCDERGLSWEMSWHWVDRTVGATLPIKWLLP